MAIMQRHGLGGLLTTNREFANGGGEAVTIQDAEGWVIFNMTDKPLRLTAEQARYLSDRLRESADRIEAAGRVA